MTLGMFVLILLFSGWLTLTIAGLSLELTTRRKVAKAIGNWRIKFVDFKTKTWLGTAVAVVVALTANLFIFWSITGVASHVPEFHGQYLLVVIKKVIENNSLTKEELRVLNDLILMTEKAR